MAQPIDDWASAAVARYGAIGTGLLIGIAARNGLTLSEGGRLTRRALCADLLLFGMLGVIGIAIGDWLKLSSDDRVLLGTLIGVSGERLVRLARAAFLKRVSAEVAQLADIARAGDIVKVPAGAGVPDELGAHSGTADNPAARTGAALQAAFRSPTITRPLADQIEALRQLDEPKA